MSMTMALKKMKINTPRIQSSKRRENHFYAPYTPSKRRAALSSGNLGPQTRTGAPNNVDVPTKGITLDDTIIMPSLESMGSSEPWGIFISKRLGKPDIPLSCGSTSLGKVSDIVDMYTGERVLDSSKSTIM